MFYSYLPYIQAQMISLFIQRARLRTIHEETLAKAVDEARQLKPGLKVATELKEGEPAAQIVDAANEGGFDVIVVGHRGLGRLSEVLLGVVSERVAHLAKCAVAIIK
jgi:nucleotide-binding universal stress UspA family protein